MNPPDAMAFPPPSKERQSAGPRAGRVARCLIVLVIVFNVLLPKGGFAVGGIPITWGYLLLGGSAGLWIIGQTIARRSLVSGEHGLAFACIIPLQICVIFSLLIVGSQNKGMALAALINITVLPAIFLLCLGTFFNEMRFRPVIYKTLVFCVFGAAFYGIVLFLYHQKTGKLFEVPFITTNGQQEVALDQRHNMRGSIAKLISTYNNGNIYGACTLLLLPLHALLCRNRLFVWTVKGALILTLSRTAWIGVIVYEGLALFLSRRGFVQKVLICLVSLLVALVGIVGMTYFMGRNASWLFDSNLGGRAEMLDRAVDTQTVALVARYKFSGLGEIVYADMLYRFGMVGLLTYLIAMTGYPLLEFLRNLRKILEDNLKKAALLGMFLYWVISGSDGAFSYIPTMSFYWFLMALFCSKSDPRMRQASLSMK
jgi:hypothetical protein